MLRQVLIAGLLLLMTALTACNLVVTPPVVTPLPTEPTATTATGSAATPVAPTATMPPAATATSAPATATTVPATATTAPATATTVPATATSAPVSDEPSVQEIALILDGLPAQVTAIVSGTLPDACAFVERTDVAREGDTFRVVFTLARHPNQRCAPQPTPFRETVPLDVAGLPAGTYHVAAHNARNAFALAFDNVPSNVLSGRLWHDLCALGEQEQPVNPPTGCVPSGNSYAANGIMEPGEPGIEGVTVGLGRGACPMSDLMSTTTGADGYFVFDNLPAGTYCVLIDPVAGSNVPLLVPGQWTAPAGTKGAQTVTFDALQGAQTVNFGWDYQFLPAPDDTSTCLLRATFVADVTIPDGATVAPGETFVKTWRVTNAGTCAWEPDDALVWVDGPHQPGLERPVPFGQTVSPGQTTDLSVTLTAPTAPGHYRIEWMLSHAGEQFGVGPGASVPIYVDFVVN